MTNSLDAFVRTPLPIEPELRWLFRRSAALTIFDVGACEGEDSVRYARLFPRSTVFAVEPLPTNLDRIRATLDRFGATNVKVVPLALSDSRGTANLFVSAGQPPDMPVSEEWDYGNKSSSLLEPERHLEVHPWVRFDQVITVETRTFAEVCIDRGVGRVDLIHLDVQGAELRVLDGLGPMLQDVTAIWLEVEAVPLYRNQPLKGDVEEYLSARGFKLSKDTVDDVSGDQLWVGKRGQTRSLFSGLRALARRLTWALHLEVGPRR